MSVTLLFALTSALGGQRAQLQRALRAASSATGTRASGEHVGPSTQLPPVLLMTPQYYGTLAAVRSFGRAAISVTIAGPSRWSVSAFSKYTQSSLVCPPTTKPLELLAWLEDFGRAQERHVLIATCDDTAWLYARYRDRLSKYFYLGSPGVETTHSLLHKAQLAEHAAAVGLDSPKSWLPQSASELAALASESTFPLLIKPTTQALFPARSKGRVVDGPAELIAAHREMSELGHGTEIVEYDPTSALPLVQEFFPDASERIYNISGYAKDGKLCGARAGRKILQRPRRLGVGVCFEEAELDLSLVQGLERLAQRVGFHGVFEAEFVKSDGRAVLIDFNPRFYNQMGFDVARGLPLPLLAYQDAFSGADVGQQLPQCADIQAQQPTGKVFVYSSAFKVMVQSQRLSGALTSEQADSWLAWYAANEANHVDAVDDPDDVWPGRLDTMQMLRHHVRHPRSFWRSIVMNR